MAQSSSPNRKTIFADYFLGFATRNISGGCRPWRLYYESEQQAGHTEPRCKAAFSGDLYLNGDIKDIASTYYPAIGPYDTTDEDVAEFHILLAKSAGIDGFMAEFTMGQEAPLLNLVRTARKYQFQVGVNWINQSHFGENPWPNRAAAFDKARQLIRWMMQEVYGPSGTRLGEQHLLFTFLAHPRSATKDTDVFFSPEEVRELKQIAHDAGRDLQILTLPWEPLPDLPADAPAEVRAQIWDGYFPWIWVSASSPEEAALGLWSHDTPRSFYLQRLRDYYTMAQRLQQQGRIGTYIGAVCPGFDDHKGQAWGEAFKRHVPRDGGSTFHETWDELKRSGVDTALLITWNDWVESSQVEPSLELGYSDLLHCAREIAGWKQAPFDERLVMLPKRLFHARKSLRLLAKAGVASRTITHYTHDLDVIAQAISTSATEEAEGLLAAAEQQLETLKGQLHTQGLHIFWEYGFDSHGLSANHAPNTPRVTVDRLTGAALSEHLRHIGFRVGQEQRTALALGHFVGRLCFEYLDVGTDFIQVLVDAPDEQHQVIASFKKTNTGKWRTASLDLVNARFIRGLPGTVDLLITQPGHPGGLRMLRIDGTIYSS